MKPDLTITPAGRFRFGGLYGAELKARRFKGASPLLHILNGGVFIVFSAINSEDCKMHRIKTGVYFDCPEALKYFNAGKYYYMGNLYTAERSPYAVASFTQIDFLW